LENSAHWISLFALIISFTALVGVIHCHIKLFNSKIQGWSDYDSRLDPLSPDYKNDKEAT